MVTITASGNLAFSHTEDLAFQTAGIVAEVSVKAGDSVKQGQVLATLDTTQLETNLASLQSSVLSAQISLANAELTLEQAEEATTTTVTGDIRSTTTDPRQIEIMELQVELAKARLASAQKTLADAQNASPEITAPFDGFISNVNVSAGDAGAQGNGVPKGTVAMTIVDPNKFEADILVSEMDIYQVKVGGAATVQADAFPGVTFPATVTQISPTATIQSGVVNYKVTVEVQSLEPVTSARSTSQTTTIPANFQLRQGLTVTVNIIVAQKTGVLLVPSSAITTERGQSYVQVVSSTGAIEKRAIKTGITNYTNTEVTEGLSEGEKVVVKQGTSSTSTSTTQQQRPQGGMFFGP
jgi:RND family efflux transporter MFP subunit